MTLTASGCLIASSIVIHEREVLDPLSGTGSSTDIDWYEYLGLSCLQNRASLHTTAATQTVGRDGHQQCPIQSDYGVVPHFIHIIAGLTRTTILTRILSVIKILHLKRDR